MNSPMFGHFTSRPERVETDVAVVIPHARVNLLVQPVQKNCNSHFHLQNIKSHRNVVKWVTNYWHLLH